MPDLSQEFGHYRHLAAFYRNEDTDSFRDDNLDLLTAESNARTILPYSQRSNPNLTLHDAAHSLRVIAIINSIIDVIKNNGGTLSRTEIRILYFSAWYHDIGIILSENEYGPGEHKYNHAQLSVKILRAFPEEYFKTTSEDRDRFIDAVCRTILSHRHGTEDVPATFRIHEETVRLRLVSAILCLADLCDISSRRAPKMVYDLLSNELNMNPLDGEEIRHWVANIATTIDFNVRYQTIFIRFESRLKCKVILDSMEKYGNIHIKTISEYVSFPVSIEYIPSAENDCEETY